MIATCWTVFRLWCSGWMAGGAESFADYSQWEAWQAGTASRLRRVTKRSGSACGADYRNSGAVKKKLSYIEAREYASIEERVAAAEIVWRSEARRCEDPTIASDSPG